MPKFVNNFVLLKLTHIFQLIVFITKTKENVQRSSFFIVNDLKSILYPI